MKELINKLNISKKNIPLFVLVIGIVIVLLSSLPKPKSVTKSSLTYDEDDYTQKLEQRVEGIVSSIKGAGECNVMINLSSSSESVYVKENKKSFDSDSETSKGKSEDSIITMTDSGGNQYALVTKCIMPQIAGATVVCKGGDDPSVKEAVTDAVCTVLGIGANKVCVIAKS